LVDFPLITLIDKQQPQKRPSRSNLTAERVTRPAFVSNVISHQVRRDAQAASLI
jgi:hypothetical protein